MAFSYYSLLHIQSLKNYNRFISISKHIPNPSGFMTQAIRKYQAFSVIILLGRKGIPHF